MPDNAMDGTARPYQELCISARATILEAMRQLNDTGKRLLLIVINDTLVGVITDGDIRRHILANGDLSLGISSIMKTKPTVLKPNELDKAKRLFKRKGITAIPLVDEFNHILDILFIEDVIDGETKASPALNLPVVIMAGGEGTRLYPYTKVLPKPLIPIGDTPILERIMNRFYSYGCSKFYVTVNYRKNMIKAYLNESELPYCIEFVEEERPLGTGGSLAYLKGTLTETFILSNCDILVNADMAEVVAHHREKGNLVTIVAALRHHVIPYGVIEVGEGGYISGMIEKPQYNMLVNTGVYIVEPGLLETLEDGIFIHITQMIENAIAQGERVGVYPIPDNAWFDMGQLDELERMYEHFEHN